MNETIALHHLEGNDLAQLTPLQTWLTPQVETIYLFWWLVWVLVLVVLLVTYIIKPTVQAWKNGRNK